MTTPKPTPTLMEDLGKLYVIGGLDDEFERLRAALERLEELEAQADADTERLSGAAKIEHALRSERDAAIDYQNALRGEIHRLQSERDAERSRAESLETGLNALLDQIDRGTFVDQHGHDARMLKPVHDGMKLMTSTPAADLAARSAERDREQREHDDRIRREAVEKCWNFICTSTGVISEKTIYAAAGLKEAT